MLYLLHLRARKPEIKGGNIKITLPPRHNGKLSYKYSRNSERVFEVNLKQPKRAFVGVVVLKGGEKKNNCRQIYVCPAEKVQQRRLFVPTGWETLKHNQ